MTSAERTGHPLTLVDAKLRRLTPEQRAIISTAVQKQLRSTPRRIRLIPTLEADLVCEISLAGGDAIFKAAPTGREGMVALEAWACRRVRRAGVPAPRILGLDTSGRIYPGPYLLQEKVQGIPLSRVGSRRRRRWRSLVQAGKYLRRIHEINMEGFGRLNGPLYLKTRKVRGRYHRWSDALLRPAHRRLAYVARHGLVDRAAIREIRWVLSEYRSVLHPVAARLLHGDFGSSHMFVDPATGKFTGIIDFADRKAGDPLWDIAWFTHWHDQRDFRELIAGYGLTTTQVEASAVTLQLYVLLQAIGDIVWLHERKQRIGPHIRVMRVALTSLMGRDDGSVNRRRLR